MNLIKPNIKFLFNKIFKKKRVGINDQNVFGKVYFSQEGEDIVLERYFENQEFGTFVDVGAHHPFRFSNTFLLYKKGWRGINIEPMPESLALFNKFRPEDINLNIGISESEKEMSYFMFNESALNTFSNTEAEYKNGIHDGLYYIIAEQKIPTYKLSTILDKYLNNNNIDFLSIDVEGLDLEVLKSNNWEKYRPRIILVEELRQQISTIQSSSEINSFLVKKGYELYSRTYNTSFYLRNNEF